MGLPLEFYATAGAVNAFTSITLGIAILIIAPKVLANRIFSYFCFSMGIWSLFYAVWLFTPDDPAMAEFWVRTCMAFVCFIPTTFLHFTVLFLNLRVNKIWMSFSYLISIILASSVYTLLFIKGMFPINVFPYWPEPGILFHIHIAHFMGQFSISFYLLFMNLKNAEGNFKNQIRFVLAAIIIAFISGTPNYLPWYHVPIPPFVNICVSLYVFMIAYAIIKHQLMDIRVIIKKSIVYTVLITFITLLYFLIIYLVERLFQGIIGYQSVIASMATATVIALLFIPLRNVIQSFIDKHFFTGSLSQIAEQNVQLREEITRSEKYKTLATLTDGMAHEIKNPLTALKGYSHFLQEKHNDPAFIQKFSKVLESELNKIDGLIQQLKDYGKPAPPAVESTDIVKLVSDTIDIMKNNLLEKNINVTRSLDTGEKLNLVVDPVQVRQALLNIILNAIEAMPNGGQLMVSAKKEEDRFQISIKDNGCGIAPEHLSRIFDPFFSLKEKNKGLGLAITQGIIENHHGKIRVKSELKAGTEMIIELPLKGKKE